MVHFIFSTDKARKSLLHYGSVFLDTHDISNVMGVSKNAWLGQIFLIVD